MKEDATAPGILLNWQSTTALVFDKVNNSLQLGGGKKLISWIA